MSARKDINKTSGQDRHKVLLLYRHLAVQAFAVSVMMWMFGGAIWGLLNPLMLLASGAYAFVVLIWAVLGSRFVVYLGLQAAGFTFVAVIALLSSLATLEETGYVNAVVILLVSYIASMAALAIVGVRRWRDGPSGFLARPANWDKGTYDVGALAAFFFGARFGEVRQSELATDSDRAWLKKRGWLIYLVLFSTPIVAAVTVTRGVNAGALPLSKYILALLSGLGAVSEWVMCNWYWKWGHTRGCPMLVKQFAHRYKQTK